MKFSTENALSRRKFLLAAGATAFVLAVRRADAQPGPIVIGLLRRGNGADFARGFALGAAEAERAFGFAGRSLRAVTSTDLARLLASGCSAVVGAVTGPAAARAQEECSRRGVLYLNAADDRNELRHPACGTLAYHVCAMRAMRGAAGAREWDARLTRYGAAQLNARYAARFKTPMSADAWSAWMSVKCAVEAALRARAASGRAIARHVASPSARFDGHKGVALRFDAATRQLVQPLYAGVDLREIRVAPTLPAVHAC